MSKPIHPHVRAMMGLYAPPTTYAEDTVARFAESMRRMNEEWYRESRRIRRLLQRGEDPSHERRDWKKSLREVLWLWP